MNAIQIRLLGRFAVTVDGETVPNRAFGGRLVRTFLRMLAVRRGTAVPKDVLAEDLWGDDPPSDPAANLDVLASRTRRALGDRGVILWDSGGYVLGDHDRVSVDSEAVLSAVLRGRNYLAAKKPAAALAAFQEALGAWGGEPLVEDSYSEWAQPFRRELVGAHLEALEGGAQAALHLRNAVLAVELAKRAIVVEPLRETPNLLLVGALAQSGDQVGALAAFQEYRRLLADEAGLDPSPEASDIQAQILRGTRSEPAAALFEIVPREGDAKDARSSLSGRGSGPMRARAMASMAMLAAGSDDYSRAAELVELALADAGDDQRALAEVLYVGSIIDMNLGRLDRSAERAEEALGHFEMLGDDHGVADILDGRAMATFMGGRISEGVAAFERVAKLFAESGDPVRSITPTSTRGHGLVFMAQPEEGLAVIDGALELARSLGEEEAEGYCLWHRAEALAAAGRGDEAVDSAERAVEIARALKHREWTAAALRALGIAHSSRGDLRSAETVFRNGLDASVHLMLFETWHAAQLALTLIRTDRTDEAGVYVDFAMQGGPPLALYEARMAKAGFEAATASPEASQHLTEFIREAEEGGHLLSLAFLTDLEISLAQ